MVNAAVAPKAKKKRTTRGVNFMLRLTPLERELFEKAADASGLQISAWMRTACVAAARKLVAA